MRSDRFLKNAIWKLYKHSVDKEGKETAKCTISGCGVVLHTKKASNLQDHARRKHPVAYVNFLNEGKGENSTEKPINIKIDFSKAKLLRAVVGLVAEDHKPFALFDSPNMRMLLDPLCMGIRDKEGKKALSVRLRQLDLEYQLNRELTLTF